MVLYEKSKFKYQHMFIGYLGHENELVLPSYICSLSFSFYLLKNVQVYIEIHG